MRLRRKVFVKAEKTDGSAVVGMIDEETLDQFKEADKVKYPVRKSTRAIETTLDDMLDDLLDR